MYCHVTWVLVADPEKKIGKGKVTVCGQTNMNLRVLVFSLIDEPKLSDNIICNFEVEVEGDNHEAKYY